MVSVRVLLVRRAEPHATGSRRASREGPRHRVLPRAARGGDTFALRPRTCGVAAV